MEDVIETRLSIYITPNFNTSKLKFNRNDPASYYVAYKTLHKILFEEASYYFNDYAVCNKKVYKSRFDD